MVVPENIKFIFFDLDGTLVDLDIDWIALKSELGLATGDTLGNKLQSYMDTNDIDKLSVVTRYEMQSVGNVGVNINTINTIGSMIEEGIGVGVFTRNSRRVVEYLFRDVSYYDKLTIIGREDVEHLKPNADKLVDFIRSRGLIADKVVLVGDTYHDIEASRAAGVKSVIKINTKLQHVPPGADIYIDNINDLRRM